LQRRGGAGKRSNIPQNPDAMAALAMTSVDHHL
jgi:hypothetical protein